MTLQRRITTFLRLCWSYFLNFAPLFLFVHHSAHLFETIIPQHQLYVDIMRSSFYGIPISCSGGAHLCIQQRNTIWYPIYWRSTLLLFLTSWRSLMSRFSFHVSSIINACLSTVLFFRKLNQFILFSTSILILLFHRWFFLWLMFSEIYLLCIY